MRYYIVDAFTDRPFGGNPAGVVLLGEEAFPDESLMIKIAAELRFSETAFVRYTQANKQSDNHAFTAHVRYFTPKAEVELCGHATIAMIGDKVYGRLTPDLVPGIIAEYK